MTEQDRAAIVAAIDFLDNERERRKDGGFADDAEYVSAPEIATNGLHGVLNRATYDRVSVTSPDRLQAAREALAEAIEYVREENEFARDTILNCLHDALAFLQSGPDTPRQSSETAALRAVLRPPKKIVSIHGRPERLIQGDELTDDQVAVQVRMLFRQQLNHEAVCTLARDRIVFLSDCIAKADAIAAALDAAAEGQGWQDMASAKKDGTPILLWVCSRNSIRRGRPIIGWWELTTIGGGWVYAEGRGRIDNDAVKLWKPIGSPVSSSDTEVA